MYISDDNVYTVDNSLKLECDKCSEMFETDQEWLDSLGDDEPLLCGECEC